MKSVEEAGPRIHDDTAVVLRTTIGVLCRRFRPLAASAGLSPTQVAVLSTLVGLGSARPSDLAAADSLNPTMLSRVVGKLEADGLIERMADPLDKRSSTLKATSAGLEVHHRLQARCRAALGEALGSLSAEHRAGIAHAMPALQALADALGDIA